MNFLMNFFESRVNSIGTIEDKEKMSKVISKWESLKTHTMQEGFAMASKEAVAEESYSTYSYVETRSVLGIYVPKTIEELTAEAKVAKEVATFKRELDKDIKKLANSKNKSDIRNRQEMTSFRKSLEGKSLEETIRLIQEAKKKVDEESTKTLLNFKF